ncbi:hypothetical protein WD019_04870 [Fictibacillus sp. Mic-4]|uniref:hypothetical protein n=1 Tax=Fictibacillus TaxID=1329200 RepID=UPI0004106690|nr:hypothetical protein [Fictibacillus gelatini]
MTITKLKTKSLVLNTELDYNKRLGLPVEVYSTITHETIAFGRIDTIDDRFVVINNKKHSRETNMFFGCPCLS